MHEKSYYRLSCNELAFLDPVQNSLRDYNQAFFPATMLLHVRTAKSMHLWEEDIINPAFSRFTKR